MPDPHGLRAAVAQVLAAEKCYDLPSACDQLGVGGTDNGQACNSKRLYVLHRLRDRSEEEVADVAQRVLEKYDAPELQETLDLYGQGPKPALSELTRRKVLASLAELGEQLPGRLDWPSFLAEVWPIHSMRSADMFQSPTLEGEIWQHMVRNPGDWTTDYLFDRLGALGASDARFIRLVERCVHPIVRDGDEQEGFAAELDALLRPDGFALVQAGTLSGSPVYQVRPLRRGVGGTPKNLIFAASGGPKPDLVLADAINNDVRIVRHGEHCLVYAEPIADSGLLWSDLAAWWERTCGEGADASERGLYHRLEASLASDPERLFFKRYFVKWKKLLGQRLPALIPQVYLHYDPLTIRARAQGRVLPRQRMDFLFLFSAADRVVVEIDGKHHYSREDGTADPERYAEMVSADRELRLGGYEVYRFGGYELVREGAEDRIDRFLSGLLMRHHVVPRGS